MLPTLSTQDHIARITFNSPDAANRLTVADLECLMKHLHEINHQPKITILIIGAMGKHFCAGFDIDSLQNDAKDKSLLFEEVVNLIEDCRPITIARIQGGVFGGATDLALACDFRIGSTAAEMMMPAAKLGIHFYQRGLERYITRLGLDQAKRLLLLAEHLQSDEMKKIGFLTTVVEDSELDQHVHQLTQQLSQLAPIAILGMKKHLNAIAGNRFSVTALQKDIAMAQNSDDLQEGRLAWLEKRAPQFKGR